MRSRFADLPGARLLQEAFINRHSIMTVLDAQSVGGGLSVSWTARELLNNAFGCEPRPS